MKIWNVFFYVILFFGFLACKNATTDPVDLGNVNGIPIEKESSVTVTQALATADNIRAAYETMKSGQLKFSPVNISKVIIVKIIQNPSVNASAGGDCIQDQNNASKWIIKVVYSCAVDWIESDFSYYCGGNPII